MPEQYQPEDQFIIKDLETLKVIADPLRMQIMKSLKKGRTVKEVAAVLGKPPTKLYYHINQLERHNLIRIVETNIVSGIIEKRYQVAAHRYRIKEDLLTGAEVTDEHLDAVLETIFDVTQAEIKDSIKAGLMELSEESPYKKGYIFKTSVSLQDEQVADFGARLESLLEECEALAVEENENPEAREYGFTAAFYPLHRTEEDNDNE